jgi:hypothetical protein
MRFVIFYFANLKRTIIIAAPTIIAACIVLQDHRPELQTELGAPQLLAGESDCERAAIVFDSANTR